MRARPVSREDSRAAGPGLTGHRKRWPVLLRDSDFKELSELRSDAQAEPYATVTADGGSRVCGRRRGLIRR